ncbi:MAG: hypothetical protein HN888_13975, partial [Desulfobacula sp.]|nr:hypothetical protein [Desulfobacula sp.]
EIIAPVSPSTKAVCYKGDAEKEIPEYKKNKEGIEGFIYYKNIKKHRNYLVDINTSAEKKSGKWVTFPCWSGQDGQNQFKDNRSKKAQLHLNRYHVVNISPDNLKEKPLILGEDILSDFKEAVKEMSLLAQNRQDKEEKELSRDILKMKGLKQGDFVYFKADDDGITSIGRHYRYLRKIGEVKTVVDNTNNGQSVEDCPVRSLAGWADESNTEKSMKGRLWVEMAIGPDIETIRDEEIQIGEKTIKKLVQKNLRILASQTPKASQFYIDQGKRYNDATAKIRRKFFWHDPYWYKKMWDNEDLSTGDFSFENPDPDSNKTQWSQAEVMMATEKDSIKYKATVRVMNLTEDEFGLLLTSLLGFFKNGDSVNSSKDNESKNNDWYHKLGHARPFFGSTYFTLSGIESLDFNKDTGEPVLLECDDWQNRVYAWQKSKTDPEDIHLKYLRRIMRFHGAREGLKQSLNKEDIPITYPLGQNLEPDKEISWKNLEQKDQPKTYIWFANNSKTLLPDPEEGEPQTLDVKIVERKKRPKKKNRGHK